MKISLSIFITILILLNYTATVYAQEAFIEDLRVVHGDNVNLAFAVKGAFTDDITEAINSGIPTSFTYIVKLYKKRSFLPDDYIQTLKFNHTVKFDNLRKEYVITLHRGAFGVNDIVLKTEDFEEMKKIMITANDLNFVPKKSFESGYTYRILVKAELDVVNLPLAVILDYMLFFIKLWDFETDWYEYNFTY